jgi:hypothetical protein
MIAPWMVPVPVRPSEFVPLHAEHATFNVETFLGGIEAFGATTTARSDLLFCDLQTNPDTTMGGRLGSGRAGVYGGKYLKGVGRTLLAGNWADATDPVHHTGHLPASAAVREYLVTVYLEAKGARDLVNPCEGILLKPLAPSLRALQEPMLRDDERRWTSDASLQAITVKPAGFARFSNLVWLSEHLDFHHTKAASATKMARFVELFLASVDPSSVPRADATPKTFVAALLRAFERGLETLRRSWSLGVSWVSLHNNFSADGRYLDLEGPVISGAPLVGILDDQPRASLELPDRAMVTGLFEPLVYVRAMRSIGHFFQSRFAGIRDMGSLASRAEKAFAAGIAEELAAVRGDHVLYSRELLGETLTSWVEGVMDLSRDGKRALRDAIDVVYDVYFTDTRRERRASLEVTAVDAAPLARRGMWRVAHVVRGTAPPMVVSQEARLFNRLVAELDAIGDRDTLLLHVESAAAELRRSVSRSG